MSDLIERLRFNTKLNLVMNMEAADEIEQLTAVKDAAYLISIMARDKMNAKDIKWYEDELKNALAAVDKGEG